MPEDTKQSTPDVFESEFLDMVNDIVSGKARTYCLMFTEKEGGDLRFCYSGGSWETLGVLAGVASSIEERLGPDLGHREK